MGLSGTIDPTVYEGLKDVLQRYPTVTTVTYEPNSIVKQSLQAQIDPNRVIPPSGPEAPTLDVEWRFADQDEQYRIHYADPNLGFDCGWHRDDDHPELGPVHFQYSPPGDCEPEHERATISKEAPTEVLWLVLERLFEKKLPGLLDSS
jgi:hypothetical protein